MTAIIERLQADGLHLFLEGDKLKAGPKHMMTNEHRAIIREHKPSILKELRREGPPYPDGMGRVKCIYCRRLGPGDVCLQTGRAMCGISLLYDCEDYAGWSQPRD